MQVTSEVHIPYPPITDLYKACNISQSGSVPRALLSD